TQGTGHARTLREVETDVRPLWDKYHEKGLRVVGVSMDLALSAAQIEAIRKEWNPKEELLDGSLESVRKWTEKRGVEWPWYWDGAWTNNPISKALGGVAQSEPAVVLVDKNGIIRWQSGKWPFTGLVEEVAKLFP